LVVVRRKSPSWFSSVVFLLYVAGHMTTRHGPDSGRTLSTTDIMFSIVTK